jgi:cystathionine beta-lyase/cystathionine gamma-synthase
MSSEQPKLNNSEVNNNSTSGESPTAPQTNVMASQPAAAPATHTTEPDESDESRSGGDVDFAQLLDQFEQEQATLEEGEVVRGTVVGLSERGVVIDFGYKSEGIVNPAEFTENGQLTVKAGDEVIFESHAHPGGSFPWLNQAKLRGIVVKLFEPDPRDGAGNVARIAALMTPRTRVVQGSHVTAPTGVVMPVAAIAKLCRDRGVWFHVDGAQSAGMFPFSLREIGCDSFATSGHKWLGGPLETGVLFVQRARLDEVAPVLVGAYFLGQFVGGKVRLLISGKGPR